MLNRVYKNSLQRPRAFRLYHENSSRQLLLCSERVLNTKYGTDILQVFLI